MDRLQKILELIWSIHSESFGVTTWTDQNGKMPRPILYKFVQWEDFES